MPPRRAPRTPMATKLTAICDHIHAVNLTPKAFITAFLQHTAEDFAFKRRFWGTDTGWDSTVGLLEAIQTLVSSHVEGRELWDDWVLAQATQIVIHQNPRQGNYPAGGYVSSGDLKQSFFTEQERLSQNSKLTDSMPFLYNLIYKKMNFDDSDEVSSEKTDTGDEVEAVEDPEPEEVVIEDPITADDMIDELQDPELKKGLLALSEQDINVFEGFGLVKNNNPTHSRRLRADTVARTICAMVSFGCNRRQNCFQMRNSLMFLAAGVTERVNTYLNYVGLSSSRRTAHAALKTLGSEAELKVKSRLALGPILPPSICFDNLDFQQKVHMKSVGKCAVMFHGTWGYIHSPPPSILPLLNPAELTTEALNKALHIASKQDILLKSFAPTQESTNHFAKVLKSQITRVILRYVALPVGEQSTLHRNPPSVQPIAAELPNVAMLKLMVASDNSAQGVGEVFTGIIQQSGLTPQEFHSRVQIIEGDLGTCNIFDTLRNQRTPGHTHKASLDNVLPIPGAAHTLWNIAQALFLYHWGDEKHSRDTGAWRTLHALGIQADKPTTKKDFNLMLSHIERIHEANLLYCALVILGKDKDCLGEKLINMTAGEITRLVEETYETFCTIDARESERASKFPAYGNMLLRIRDFATIVEAARAMKAGDPGRLMYMWERWAFMTQALPKLPHYSKHLPKLIVMMKEVLPASLARVVESTLLISPTGRPNHFVATDCFLEQQNYWLKYFFNHSGIGTNINRLKDVFSINIPVISLLATLSYSTAKD
ncbi:uncharacterized protein PGTG_10956 [Puccinia graminis f. sp. tritici CRL 75-36-700-3]|uniref:DUF6589 domain-containing protein n=1 Tax=Puccinia graminis f. sp. tritici (strain CRL 75-36-700-3 / race SCCL) TaxID=418459 RepID=E3KMZ1_PUCGT|nr:uncharacterized protein PGTG_10956 [Puccinia graminis f. sp. tritici CRL 75-36-700-3]EFP85627.2 hypothetical protein PGTG_10956 [Puccinia graminis f. sp. tritici CRL 75-36-700-3]